MGQGVKINGKIEMQGHGTFSIGSNVVINSRWDVNPIGGGNGRTVLQTLGDGKIFIGESSGLSHAVIVSRSMVDIGKNVLIGGGVQIFDTDFHQIDYRDRNDPAKIKSKPVIIEDNAFIGACTIILKGVTIGNGAVIGAGSVVTKNVPAGEIWAGNPAVFVKKI